MMTSGRTLATAVLTDGASSASPMTGSAPDSERLAPELCERTMPKVLCPARVRLFISGRPMAPVAPATKTFTTPPFFAHFIDALRYLDWRLTEYGQPEVHRREKDPRAQGWLSYLSPAPEARNAPSGARVGVKALLQLLSLRSSAPKERGPHKLSSALAGSNVLKHALILRDDRLAQRPTRWPKCPGSEGERKKNQRRSQITGAAAGSK